MLRLFTVKDGEIIYEIPPEDNNKTLRDVLKKLKLSHNAITRFKRNSAILINGEIRFAGKQVYTGDILTIQLDSSECVRIDAEDINIDIIYEDDFLLVLNKPAGMPSHPSRRHINGTLANAAAGYLARTSPNSGVHLVNRLDRDTSGVVMIAKNSFAKHLMCEKLSTMQKTYIAVTEGMIETKSAVIDAPIARRETSLIERCVRDDGQTATTWYSVIDYSTDRTIVQVKPKTGRTHQIRVHMAHIGYPLAGDTLYGGHADQIGRHALHAWLFEFEHPIDEKALRLEADLPGDMLELIGSCHNFYAKNMEKN